MSWHLGWDYGLQPPRGPHTSSCRSRGLTTLSQSSSNAAGVCVLRQSTVYDICSLEALAMTCDPILSTYGGAGNELSSLS